MIHEEIALNEMLKEKKDINIGCGMIATLEKLLKPIPDHVKNLRPVTLLKVICKVLSKGDPDEIVHRKHLVVASYQEMDIMWLKGHRKINVKDRLQLFKSLVMHVFLYNSSMWGLQKFDIIEINVFLN